MNTGLTLGSVTSTGALSLTAETIDINQSISTNPVTTGTITLLGETVNLGANLSTDGAMVSISGSTAVVLDAATVSIDTESGNDGSAGAVTFAGTGVIRADAAGRNLVINTDTSNGGSSNGGVTLAAFGNGGVAFVNNVTIDADDAATTGATVTIPAASQIAGTLSITAGPIASNATFTAGAATTISSDVGRRTSPTATGATANFVAATGSLTASSATGIDLDTTIATLTSASVSAGGDINISDTAGGLTVTSATTSGTGGNITLEATGGNLTLTTVTAGGSGDVVASTATSGDILVGNVTATSDTITLISATGAIEESGADAGSDVSAATIELTAATGIGAAAQIEIDANTAVGEGLTADVGLAGNINLRDADAIRINSVISNGGSITLGAGGNLTLGGVADGGQLGHHRCRRRHHRRRRRRDQQHHGNDSRPDGQRRRRFPGRPPGNRRGQPHRRHHQQQPVPERGRQPHLEHQQRRQWHGHAAGRPLQRRCRSDDHRRHRDGCQPRDPRWHRQHRRKRQWHGHRGAGNQSRHP